MPTLGLPSPSLSRSMSPSPSPTVGSSNGDLTEVARLSSQLPPYHPSHSSLSNVLTVAEQLQNVSIHGQGLEKLGQSSKSPRNTASPMPAIELSPERKTTQLPTTSARRFPEEEDEDLLRETDDRFVLFPIKYNEVRYTSRGHHI